MKWLKRIKEYYKDKELAEKCGLEVKDICVHESDGKIYGPMEWGYSGHYKCKKCGEFYR